MLYCRHTVNMSTSEAPGDNPDADRINLTSFQIHDINLVVTETGLSHSNGRRLTIIGSATITIEHDRTPPAESSNENN